MLEAPKVSSYEQMLQLNQLHDIKDGMSAVSLLMVQSSSNKGE